MSPIDSPPPIRENVVHCRREVREVFTRTTTRMATTSKDPMTASIQLPGQPVYVRTGEDVESPAHREHIEKWIQDYEKNRPVFVFPSAQVRRFGIMILVLSLASLLLQVLLSTGLPKEILVQFCNRLAPLRRNTLLLLVFWETVFG